MRHKALVISIAAAMAAVTSPASAQTEPMAHDQDTGGVSVMQEVPGTDPLCPAVTPTAPPATPEVFTSAGGCRLHVTGTGILMTAHVFGIEMADASCSIEFDMRVDAGGEGWLSHQELTQGATGTCRHRACHQSEPGAPPPTGQTEGRPWGFYSDETGPGQEASRALLCIEPRGQPNNELTHCEIVLPLSQPQLHRYQLTATDSSCNAIPGFPVRWELTGTLAVEATPGVSGEGLSEQNVEIVH